jgi:hypothetical protein
LLPVKDWNTVLPLNGVEALALWKYEMAVSSHAWNALWEYLPFTRRQAQFAAIAWVLTVFAGLILGHTDAVVDALLGTCVVLVVGVLFYLFLRVKAPIDLAEEAQAATKRLKIRIEELETAIRPKLKIIYNDSEEPWMQIQPMQDPVHHIASEGYLRTCRIAVINLGLEVVRNVRVEMVWITPRPPAQRLVPCFLHYRHDNDRPYAETKDLRLTVDPEYRDALFVDVIWFWSCSTHERMGIWSTVSGVEQGIKVQNYEMGIKVSSDNGGEPIIAICSVVVQNDKPLEFKVSPGTTTDVFLPNVSNHAAINATP